MEQDKYEFLLNQIREKSKFTAELICPESATLQLNEELSIMYNPETAQNILHNTFGHDNFLPMQEKVIQSILEKNDTIAIMPTGGGKSLCYQIPGLIFEGLTIVISPLIALMQDQIYILKKLKIKAEYLSSSMRMTEYTKVYKKVQSGKVKILYLSPEALNTNRITALLKSSPVEINCITIDEAHCISEWGNDFRPDYLEIAYFRNQFPNVPCLALTATATRMVQNDIARKLNMKNPQVFVSTFNRPNLFIDVRRKVEPFQQLLSYIQAHRYECGIVYCSSRKKVDELTEKLLNARVNALNYHAGLTDEIRRLNQEDFIKDRVQVMVATVAFGMGINKSNVRYVIHYDIPKSIEQYYQEIGRAGRDGKPAEAILFYNEKDINVRRRILERDNDPTKSLNLFNHMISFCTTSLCRRKLLLNYFGETQLLYQNKNFCCDNCKNQNALSYTVNKNIRYNTKHFDFFADSV